MNSAILKRVALLATGDEIANGDILNTNGQYIAQRLFDQGINLGLHAVVKDQQTDIEKALQFLITHHQAVIITGGLGPTSDDRTRFALANVIGEELIFNPSIWDYIVERLNRYTTGKQPDSNRQQALFPKSADILANANGTAAGCHVTYKDCDIFMLPGPPGECRPIFDEQVLPHLLTHNYAQSLFHERWLLFNVSEGKIAAELDEALKDLQCTTGYRLAYPYLEFKLFAANATDFKKACEIVKPLLTTYLLAGGKCPVSELLRNQLEKLSKFICIHDHATGGLLAQTLLTPQSFNVVHFHNYTPKDFYHLELSVEGLKEYWHGNNESAQTMLKLTLHDTASPITIEHNLPNRGKRTLLFAVEIIAYEILQRLQNSILMNN